MRAVPTRVVITPHRFVNDYQWGDLKANPMDWMRRYFDGFVYTANWGSCQVVLRVPLPTFRAADLKTYASKHAQTIEAGDEHWLFEWTLDESEEFERALRGFLRRHAKRGAVLRRLNAAMSDRDALAPR